MPSNGTETLTIRVKPSAKETFKRLSENEGVSLTDLFDELIVTYRDRGTPLENTSVDEFGLLRIPELLREKGYPENLISRTVDNIIIQIRESPDYNPRRDSGDWGA